MDEEEIPKLAWDHQIFLVNGKPFYPNVEESGNTLLVRLPCRPSSDLNWTIPSTTKYILWDFDFGLEDSFFPLTDEFCFQNLSLACKHFSQTIWPHYKNQTLGGILYRGSADFSAHFLWNEVQKTNYETWIEQNPSLDMRCFCADAFCSYFQLLAHLLPDELPLVLCLDTSPISSLARALHLLSKERFYHFLLSISATKWPIPSLRGRGENLSFYPIEATQGLCFPKNEYMTEDLFIEIDKILEELYESNRPFRVIFEEFLTEQWENLDEIFVLPHVLSSQGRRKLIGFEAAGGKIVEIRGRGI